MFPCDTGQRRYSWILRRTYAQRCVGGVFLAARNNSAGDGSDCFNSEKISILEIQPFMQVSVAAQTDPAKFSGSCTYFSGDDWISSSLAAEIKDRIGLSFAHSGPHLLGIL